MLVKHPLIQFREAFESLEKETAKEYYKTAVARERSFSRS